MPVVWPDGGELAKWLPSTAYRPSVKALAGTLSFQLIYFSPIIKISYLAPNSTATGQARGQHWFRVHQPRFGLILSSYIQELHEMVKPTIDHIFYTKNGTPLLMRKLCENNELWKIVAPLHGILILRLHSESASEDSQQRYDLLRDLVFFDLTSSSVPRSQMPALHSDDLITDPTLERRNPRLARKGVWHHRNGRG